MLINSIRLKNYKKKILPQRECNQKSHQTTWQLAIHNVYGTHCILEDHDRVLAGCQGWFDPSLPHRWFCKADALSIKVEYIREWNFLIINLWFNYFSSTTSVNLHRRPSEYPFSVQFEWQDLERDHRTHRSFRSLAAYKNNRTDVDYRWSACRYPSYWKKKKIDYQSSLLYENWITK